jgi:NAD(P)-dependent dehydrogenase (short-subunit alcohol dehydrogenase family)
VPETALVTGAGRGLGRAIAHRLARRGLAVHVTDVDPDAARAVAQELGPAARASALDVADREAVHAAARDTPDLAVWVNNAGILMTGYAWEHDEATRRRAFDVNTHGLMNGTDAALEAFRARGGGRLINVISLAGLVAPPGEALYGATKHAALAYTLGTRLDLRRAGITGIEISALCPDGIWTPMLEPLVRDPDAWPSWSGVMYTPEQIAAKAVTLLDRPRPVLAVPRWRGGFARLVSAAPGITLRLLPLIERDALRRQRRWAERVSTPPG